MQKSAKFFMLISLIIFLTKFMLVNLLEVSINQPSSIEYLKFVNYTNYIL